MDYKNDIQSIIDYSHLFAEHLLVESKEFYPFGTTIDNEGALHPIAFADDETDMPDCQKVINALTAHFEEKFKTKTIKAYAMTYDVRVQISDLGDKSDAILIDIVHREASDIPQYFFPYSWDETGNLVFGKGFAMER